MNSIRRLAVTLAAGTRLLLGATDGNVANASTIYASEATFLSAAGSVTVEDFEQSPLSGTESAARRHQLVLHILRRLPFLRPLKCWVQRCQTEIMR